MFFLGHLGIGSRVVQPVTQGLPQRYVLWGTVLPDLLDKPLYYGLSWFFSKRGAELGIISGSRSLGHTAITLLLLSSFAWIRKSKILAALSLGVASHLVLDSLSDLMQNSPESLSSGFIETTLLWPFLGLQFPTIPYHSLQEHLSIWQRPVLVWTEALGLFLLFEQSRFNVWKKNSSYRTKRRK